MLGSSRATGSTLEPSEVTLTRSVCARVETALNSFPIFPGEGSSPGPIAELIVELRHDARLFRSVGDDAAADRLQAAVETLSKSAYTLHVFVLKELTPTRRAELRAALRRIHGVASLAYLSSKELLEEAAAVVGDNPLLNPGSRSSLFEASLSMRVDVKAVMQQVGSLPHVVDYAITNSSSITDALTTIVKLCSAGLHSAGRNG